MRFSTDDGSFGFIVTPLTDSGLYRFQVIVQGNSLGDVEPCYLESAMTALGKLPKLDDDRLCLITKAPISVMETIDADGELQDALLLQGAESLDEWKIYGYENRNKIMFLAEKYPILGRVNWPTLVSVVPVADYFLVYGIAYNYWAKSRGRLAKDSDL